MDENILVCPTCGQTLPEEIKLQKIADYEIRRQDHKTEYDVEKERFEKNKKASLENITKQGNATVDEIKNKKQKIQELTQEIELYKKDKVEANKNKTELQSRRDSIPDRPDLSDNQVYESLCIQVQKMEEAVA